MVTVELLILNPIPGGSLLVGFACARHSCLTSQCYLTGWQLLVFAIADCVCLCVHRGMSVCIIHECCTDIPIVNIEKYF